MILTSSTHNHTTLCDGTNTPEEMAHAALSAGFTDFGFSGHSYAPFDPDYSIRSERDYVRQLRALQRAYAGRMRIAVGLEEDYFAPVADRAALDYRIGSVHYLHDSGSNRYYAVDADRSDLEQCVAQMFGGDALRMVRAYYALVAEHAQKNRPEIIGHFDLIKKNNGGGYFFDETDAAYRAAAREALDACIQTGAIFEVNTGGIFRGYCTEPYPARFLLEELQKKGARVTVNADAHCIQALRFGFEETLTLLRDVGFSAVTVLERGQFVEKALE